jgi:hypothetical protein
MTVIDSTNGDDQPMAEPACRLGQSRRIADTAKAVRERQLLCSKTASKGLGLPVDRLLLSEWIGRGGKRGRCCAPAVSRP